MWVSASFKVQQATVLQQLHGVQEQQGQAEAAVDTVADTVVDTVAALLASLLSNKDVHVTEPPQLLLKEGADANQCDK